MSAITPAPVNLALAQSMGLNEHEFNLILEWLGREPSHTEIGMYAVMWSEHCGYKYSRPVLAYFKKYREALEGSGHENAGIVPVGDGIGVAFKVESHNHPSAVEPYQGAATGVGGILRDIFTMGARPIAALNSLRFGPLKPGKLTSPEVAQRNRFLFEHVVSGIAGYGNCVGVPTIAGEVSFHPRYSGNPLVNAMAIGVVKLDEIATAEVKGIGYPVIYIGSSTGKDGIHGASFASTGLDEGSESKRPNVQIGDPFAEKLLIETTLEALKTGAIQSIQDMGAAGLTCSTIEMAAKGRCGMEVNLDLVPMRESDMTAYELMLSESQERMLAVAYPGRENEVLEVCKKWGIPGVVIGHTIEEQIVRVKRHGIIEAELRPAHLADECPTYTTVAKIPEYFEKAKAFDIASVTHPEPNEALKILLASPNIASKKWVFQQYDQEVQTQTKIRPGKADAAVLALRGTQKGIATKIDGNSLWTYFDPYAGGLLAVCESARNVACTGAKPAAMTDGINFGNPQQGHVYWQFDQCIKGIADAGEFLDIPVVSGNVSFYNESDLGEILPTAMIGMVGILEDARNSCTMQVEKPGQVIALITPKTLDLRNDGLGASEYLSAVCGIENGLPISPNLSAEKALHSVLPALVQDNLITAAHDISDGGIAVALVEMLGNAGLGGQFELNQGLFGKLSTDSGRLFGEIPGSVLISIESENTEKVQKLIESHDLDFLILGTTAEKNLELVSNGKVLISESTARLLEFYENAIESLIMDQNM